MTQKTVTSESVWDGQVVCLINVVNEMLVESGVVDRKFVATKVSETKVKIGMEFVP